MVDASGSGTPADEHLRWRELWARTSETIGDRTHARWLCETAAGADGDEFLAALDEPATHRMVSHLDAMLGRYRAGEPLQYVLGRWGFRRLDLAVDRRALIPRPETELVAEVALAIAATAGPIRTVVDLGTGTGAIGLALADELPIDGTTVWITDVSADALDLARSNLAGIGRAGRNVRVGTGSWFDALPLGLLADVIVSNPPYVADGSPDLERNVGEWEPRSALIAGDDGLDDIRTIVGGALEHLRPHGALVLEIGSEQGAAVQSLLDAAGFVDVAIRTDLSGHDRIAVGRRPAVLFEIEVPDHGRVALRRLRNHLDDYAHLLRWLTTDEVLEWYGGRDQHYDFADILREYGPGCESERSGTISTIIELDGSPIGYVQLYELTGCAADFDLADDPNGGAGIWSIDLFVGDPAHHGRRLGRRIVRAVAEHLLDSFGATEVVIMPYPENVRAVAAYRAAGFVDGPIVKDHEVHEGVMRDGLRMHFRR